MSFIPQSDIPRFGLYRNGKKVELTGGYMVASVYPHYILFLGGPMIEKEKYLVKTLEGDVELFVSSCMQCGPSDFESKLEVADKEVELVRLFRSGRVYV